MIPEIENYAGAYRYELKFVLPTDALQETRWMLRNHPLLFAPVYPARTINNIYLDTPARENFRCSVDGANERIKVRIRWYGALRAPAAEPRLEIKFKRNLFGAKIRFPWPSLTLDGGFGVERIREDVRGLRCSEAARQMLLALEPVMINSYRREYYRSFDRCFMITLDSAVEYVEALPNVNNFRTRVQEQRGGVMELKFDSDTAADPHEVLRYLPFRLDKNSKYVRGMAALFC